MSEIPDAPLLDPETVARIERENSTVGQYERLAGIGQSHAERLAFWLKYGKHPDGSESIRLAMNECRRRIGLPQRPPPGTKAKPRRTK
ncbi:hypothetical protein [Aureimonas sp. SK2]|uniref:hypothetical protein n=1 Tax=Aureimonas sp. SK2 TaxID=3015992 RepID=UPI002444B415|nr:hypothetical protein [Aureimonas sp. SK2]